MAIPGLRLQDNATTIAMQQKVQSSNIQRPAFGSLSPTATKSLALKSYGQPSSPAATGDISEESLMANRIDNAGGVELPPGLAAIFANKTAGTANAVKNGELQTPSFMSRVASNFHKDKEEPVSSFPQGGEVDQAA